MAIFNKAAEKELEFCKHISSNVNFYTVYLGTVDWATIAKANFFSKGHSK